MKYFGYLVTIVIIAVIVCSIYFLAVNQGKINPSSSKNENVAIKKLPKNAYPIHKDVTVSIFWVGEKADGANNFISNKASAWDENWQDHFGGLDDPENRDGYLPADFTPQENPFYFALPYNDFDSDGNRKAQAFDIVYWAAEKNWTATESMCKNQWVKIDKGGQSVYAQWEDVGPFGEDDANYVFGGSASSNTEKSAAGLDVSPAVKDYLGLTGIDSVSWQFVPEKDVSDGPWKQIITTRNGN